MKMVILATFAVLMFNQAANAGLLLEPFVGYVSGTNKQSSSADFTGSAVGARVGYSFLGFAVGADYTAGSFTDDSTPKNTLTSSDIGVFFAYKFPVAVRLYATYVPSPEIKDKVSGSTSTIKTGSSMKIGVGYTGFPVINVNLEYLSASYEKVESGGTTFSLSPKATVSGYALSISAPFNLL